MISPKRAGLAGWDCAGLGLMQDGPQVDLRDSNDPQTDLHLKKNEKREQKRRLGVRSSPTTYGAPVTGGSVMLLVSHVSSISTIGASSSHQKKWANSLSTEEKDPAPAMGSSAMVVGATPSIDACHR
ncbi:hypothetical protein YC2023_028429 [Brassica napus]